MSDLIIKHRDPLFLSFMLISVAFLFGIKTTFNGGFSLTAKYLCIPFAVAIIFFVKANIKKIRPLVHWSDIRIWLFSMLLVYPLILLMAWPYVLAANAVFSSREIVEIGGLVNKKFVTTGKYGSSYHLRTTDLRTLTQAKLNVTEQEYRNIKEGEKFHQYFYEGALGIPWHWNGQAPNKSRKPDA